MTSLSSDVSYTQGIGRNRPAGEGKLILANDHLRLISNNQVVFDVSLSEIKRTKIQLGVIVVYLPSKVFGITLNQENKDDIQFSNEIINWKKAFKQANVKSSGLLRAVLIYGLGTLVAFWLITAFVGHFIFGAK